MSAELVVIHGANAGTRVPVGDVELRIGKAPESHLRLDDPDCAWRHCSIVANGDSFELVDFKSSAGTRVNGVRSLRKTLKDGDQIAIGETVVVLQKTGTVQPAG